MERNQITYTSIPDGVYSLTDRQESFMLAFESVSSLKDFFPRRFSLRDIRQGLDLVLTNRHEALNRIKDLFGIDPDSEQSRTIQRRIHSTGEDRLLGYYTHSGPLMARPKVILLMENIGDFARSTQRDAEKILLHVYLHEMMHAYYHTAGGPTVREVEEAMAEAGALLFINLFRERIPRRDWETGNYAFDLLSLAETCVREKLASPSVVCYGMGYLLYHLPEGDAMGLSPAAYFAARSGIPTEGPLIEKYRDSLKEFCEKPSPEGEARCIRALRELLEIAYLLAGSPVRLPFLEKLTFPWIIHQGYPRQLLHNYPVPVIVIPIDKYVPEGDRALLDAIYEARQGCKELGDYGEFLDAIRYFTKDYPYRGALILYCLCSRVVAYGYLGARGHYPPELILPDSWNLNDEELRNIYVNVMGQKVTLPASMKGKDSVFLTIRG